MKSRKIDGRHEYEVSPGRWVSRQRVHQLRNRKAQRARQSITEAIKRGTLHRQPCEVCGSLESQSHHYSYDNPYAIMWRCKDHHQHARPHRLKGAPIQSVGKSGRPMGKWIPPDERIKNARHQFAIDALALK